MATKVLAVTGGIGSGKSRVCRILEERGVPVYYCDQKAKDLYKREEIILQVEQLLGESCRKDDGSFDAKKVAKRVFGESPQAEKTLKELEAILHPALLEDFKAWKKAQKVPFVAFESAIVLERPLFKRQADWTLLVNALTTVRADRVVARDKCSLAAAYLRMARQPLMNDYSSYYKKPRVKFVIENNSTEKELLRQVEAVLSQIDEILK